MGRLAGIALTAVATLVLALLLLSLLRDDSMPIPIAEARPPSAVMPESPSDAGRPARSERRPAIEEALAVVEGESSAALLSLAGRARFRDGAPVPGVQLQAVRVDPEGLIQGLGGIATTDPEGRFVLEGLAPGDYAFRTNDRGLEPPDASFRAGDQEADLVFSGHLLVLHVRRASGEPAVEAPVRVRLVAPDRRERTWSGDTDEEGRFRMALPSRDVPCDLLVDVSARGQRLLEGRVSMPDGRHVVEDTVWLVPYLPASLRLRLRDQRGREVAPYRMTLAPRDVGLHVSWYSEEADADGWLRNVAPGSYELDVGPRYRPPFETYFPVRRAIQLAPGAQEDLEVEVRLGVRLALENRREELTWGRVLVRPVGGAWKHVSVKWPVEDGVRVSGMAPPGIRCVVDELLEPGALELAVENARQETVFSATLDAIAGEELVVVIP